MNWRRGRARPGTEDPTEPAEVVTEPAVAGSTGAVRRSTGAVRRSTRAARSTPVETAEPAARPARGPERLTATARTAFGPAEGEDDQPPKPSRMRPPEAGWGYLVAAVLAISAVIVLTSHGIGHRPHPAGYQLSYVGFAAAIAAVGLIRLGNRVILVADIFLSNILISYAELPKSLTLVHDVGLVVPLAYAFWLLWFRYRADQKKMLAERSRARAVTARSSDGGGSSGTRARGKKEPKVLPTGRPAPNASRRYTPPSNKRSERRT